MKKIGFVIPWFGLNITGGAEAELKGIALHMAAAGIELEILTTCVKDFNSDWSKDYYKPGEYDEGGLTVRRFAVRKRDTAKFDAVNYKLINKIMPSEEEEKIFIEEMVNSPDLYKFMKENSDEYSVFAFIPYMFGTTYYGMKTVPEKSVMIPCLHDESYIQMSIFKELYPNIAGMIFLSKPECELAKKTYNVENVKLAVLGAGVDTEISGDKNRFRNKYGINEPFMLYAGRKDTGKGVDTLIQYFCEYKRRNGTELKLVLIGGGSIDIPEEYKSQIIDLGFVSAQDKYDACTAASVLCQPSHNESFSIVIMESWLCCRPVMVSGACAVTKNFAIETNGGFYFNNYLEFEGQISYLLTHEDVASEMGKNGRKYVLDNFTWDIIVDRFNGFFKEIAGE